MSGPFSSLRFQNVDIFDAGSLGLVEYFNNISVLRVTIREDHHGDFRVLRLAALNIRPHRFDIHRTPIHTDGIAFINGDCANTLEVASTSPAPVSRVGLSEDCDCRIQNIVYSSEGSAFTIEGERYLVPMDGEFNVRNAAMAVCAARHAGLSPDTIRVSLAKFKGIARRQEVRGEVRGVRVIDDFGHHPTAIGQALRAMKLRYPVGKVWAVFEPRSNTSQRNTLQDELVEALAEADGAIIPPISAPEVGMLTLTMPQSDPLGPIH